MELIRPPGSTSTDPAQVARDYTEYRLRQQQQVGTAPVTLGVTRPLPPVNDAISAHRAMEQWGDEQRAQYGGVASDSRTTPVQDSYAQRRFDFISREEGSREQAYDDATGKQIAPGSKAKGKVHIGIGFNMDRPDAPAVLQRVLGIDQKGFNELYQGKSGLSPTQIRKLFDYTADEAEAQVQRRLGPQPLREHQRLALVSLAFNNPSLIGKELTAAVQGKNYQEAAAQLLFKTGAQKDQRLRGRRYRETLMFVGHANAKKFKIPNLQDYLEQ